MKKLLAVLLIMSIFMLVGCSSNKDANVDPSETNDSNISQNVENKDDFDKSIYSEKVELTTTEGKKVQIHYNPTVVECIEGEDWLGYISVSLGEMTDLAVKDAKSTKEYTDSIISNNSGLEIGEQKEIKIGDYKLHYFTLTETDAGTLVDKVWAIELGSDVVLTFKCFSSVEEGSQIETELNAIKFVVE